MQEKNITSYWKRDGRRPVYLKVIFKTFEKFVAMIEDDANLVSIRPIQWQV